MLRRKMYWTLAAAMIACSCWVGQAISGQGGPPAGGDRGGGRGRDRGGDRGRGRMSPEEMRKRMEEWRARRNEETRKRFKATEQEWLVLQPRIEKVQTLQRASRGSRFGGFFGGRGRRPGGDRGREGQDDRDRPEVERKTEALRNLLEDEASGPAAIKAALTALRQARARAAAQLAAARKDLQQVVTVRQEALCVMMGLLE